MRKAATGKWWTSLIILFWFQSISVMGSFHVEIFKLLNIRNNPTEIIPS